MVPEAYHDFFIAEAGASAALVGLLFVAMSVVGDKIAAKSSAVVEQARASSALSAFVIPLTLSLVALLPGARLGIPAVAVAVAGVLFVAATIRRYFSVERSQRENPRGLIGLLGFIAVVGVTLGFGIVLLIHPHSDAALGAISGASIASVLIGVDRAWALIGGHGRGRATALVDLVRGEDPDRQ